MVRFRRTLFHQRGQSLVEMALTLPILLLVFMGIMDFGRFLFLYSELSNAAREGARYGSVVGVINAGAGEVNQFRDCVAIRQAVKDRFALDVGLEDDDISITYDDGATPLAFNCDGTLPVPNPDQILPGHRVLVKVDASFTFLTPVIRSFVEEIPVSFKAARTILPGGTLTVPDGG